MAKRQDAKQARGRELLLLRHAKSSWEDPELDDFDRPLAPRGRRAAPLIGREIAARGWLPDAVLVSSALRTGQTWRLVSAELGAEVPRADHRRALYMASAEKLLANIHLVAGDTRRLLVLGHNPGLEELAAALAGPGSEPEPLARLRKKFPTAAMARFEVEGEWTDLDFGAARLTHFLRPKDLG